MSALGTAAVLLLLAAGVVQDLHRGRISVTLNRLLLAAIAVAVLVLPFRSEPVAVTAARLGMTAVAFFLFLFYIIGGADAKYLMLISLSLPFSNPLAPIQIFLIAVVAWAVIPTREGLKALDLWLFAPVVLLALIDLRAAAFVIALCLAYVRYLESSFMREKFPFLHALLIAVVLHLATPVLTGMGMWPF
jgi:Flp pilus assembly protein protease CpaA